MASPSPTCVIDVGTSYTKLGFAGETEPKYILPTGIVRRKILTVGDVLHSAAQMNIPLDKDEDERRVGFNNAAYPGNDDCLEAPGYSLRSPMRYGVVEDWNLMKEFYAFCIHQKLCIDPADHYFMLTEPQLNSPENRALMAEIMFESFNVPGLYIAAQAVLALASSWTARPEGQRCLTGTVIDSGDGVTHIIPVAEGYVIDGSIKQYPIAGRDVTYFIQQLLRERETSIPPMQTLETAKRVKEQFGYLCPDLAREFEKYDAKPGKWRKTLDGVHHTTGQPWSIDVGYERFLGPEIFYHPEFSHPDFNIPISETVDTCIQNCPIEMRRSLYKNIVLSGGSTLLKDFGRRLQRDVKRVVDARLKLYEEMNDHRIRPTPMEINVVSHHKQRYAAWFGGSMLGSTKEFLAASHTKQDYLEKGASIARISSMFMPSPD